MMASKVLLLVDDNAAHLESMVRVFDKGAYEVLTASDGLKALEVLQSRDVDVVVSDVRMPGMDGAQLFHEMKALPGLTPQMILVTAYATVEDAVELLHEGVATYLTKPLNMKEFRAQVARCMQVQEDRRKNEVLTDENRLLKAQISARKDYEDMIGQSSIMLQLIDKIRVIADTRATVLIEGESGTGKELVARAIHRNSSRASAPFVPIHCAALAESIIESELFGHEKGAFTGAIAQKSGLFELANGGTVFLDEIGDVPLSTQVKLLRVLEEREFLRVGGSKPVQVDVRVIAATNKVLLDEVEEGNFREDLYYRLGVVCLETPTLRNHSSDIPQLVEHYLEEFSKEHHGCRKITISKPALEHLCSYHWPGNVRQLRNVVENLVLFAQGDTIDEADLPHEIRGVEITSSELEGLPVVRGDDGEMKQGFVVYAGARLDVVERHLLSATLTACGGNRTRAAELLGVNRRTIIRKIQEYDL